MRQLNDAKAGAAKAARRQDRR